MSRAFRFLWQYPHVVVRVSCALCGRRGHYRLARLAERFGADATLEDVLDALAGRRCRYPRPWKVKKRKKYAPVCHIALPDLYGQEPPPRGAEGLRVVVDNERDEVA